jgi:hypothetical protein
LTQMNIKIEPEWVDELEVLAERHGWSKARAVRVAIRTLADVMAKHDDAPRDLADADIRDLYLRIAREIPGQLVEVSRTVEFLRVGEVAAVKAEGWQLWEDQATGDLLAREQEGEQRFARVIDNRIELLVAPAEAAQN